MLTLLPLLSVIPENADPTTSAGGQGEPPVGIEKVKWLFLSLIERLHYPLTLYCTYHLINKKTVALWVLKGICLGRTGNGTAPACSYYN